MRVIDPGHIYKLNHLDGEGATILTFVKREGVGYPGNVGHHEGVNLQEVLRALIDRVEYLDHQVSDARNGAVLERLRDSLWLLELRAADRHGRQLDITGIDIEHRPVCRRCGHIVFCDQKLRPFRDAKTAAQGQRCTGCGREF